MVQYTIYNPQDESPGGQLAQVTDPNPQNPSPQDGGSEGGKLYGGKWKTLEEAVDKGYTGLEQGFHKNSEEVAALRRLIEERIPEQAPYNPDNDYRAERPATEASREYLSKFYSDPVGFREEIKRETLQDLQRSQQEATKLQQIYFDWRTDNKDIGDDIALIDFYVRQQPTNLTPRQRLDRAAPFVREHVKRYKVSQPATPTSDDFIEAPGGQRKTATTAPTKPTSSEENLSSYLADRARMRNPVPKRA